MNQMNRVAGISQKYDGTLDYGITMYDELPYQRDADVCNSSTVALYSGHIIKYYLCNNKQEEYPINNRDDDIELILQKISEQEALRRISEAEALPSEAPSDEITQEQIQTLLEDNEAQEEAPEPPVKHVENLDDIEDW